MSSDAMNIYQMYVHNDYKYGFFVVRNSWTRICAQIKGIEGVKEGDPIPGDPPYYKNQNVFGDIINRFGRIEGADLPLSSPGTYAYTFNKHNPFNAM
jgi:hypothetical protein